MPYKFADLDAGHQAAAGGKGAALARMYQRGYPVPDGFVILPDEFEGEDLRPETKASTEACLAGLRKGRREPAFAVRSSALAEDSAEASFAGAFETVLDVVSDADVFEAIRTVRRSRNSARVAAYSSAEGVAQDHDMAVVVLLMIRPDFAGVLFTADPLTGNLMKMVGNFGRGVGERLVAGEANAEIIDAAMRG